MALPLIEDDAWLENPALVGIIEVADQGACPLTLTNDRLTTAQLGVGPRLYSTRDLVDLPFTRPTRDHLDRVLRQHGAVVLLRGDLNADGVTMPNAITPGTLDAELIGSATVGDIPEITAGAAGFGTSFGEEFGND